MFVVLQFCQFGVWHFRPLRTWRNRLLAKCFSKSGCNLLQGVFAKISFCRPTGERGRKTLLVQARRQLSNLERKLFCCLGPVSFGELSQRADILNDRFL